MRTHRLQQLTDKPVVVITSKPHDHEDPKSARRAQAKKQVQFDLTTDYSGILRDNLINTVTADLGENPTVKDVVDVSV